MKICTAVPSLLILQSLVLCTQAQATAFGGLTSTATLTTTASSYPSDLTPSNGFLFFVADDGVVGRQLWRSDGRPGGTTMVKAVSPTGATATITNLTDADGVLFFTVITMISPVSPATAASGNDAEPVFATVAVWKSDGTNAGTEKLTEFPPIESAGAVLVAVAKDTLFFAVDDGVHGYELWKSDGTEPGTVLVKDIQPGTAGGVASFGFLTIDHVLFFDGDDGSGGRGLWRSDGTESGTVLVKPFPPSSTPFSFAAMDGALYFGSSDYDARQLALWRSDGTAEGTVLVRAIALAGVNGSDVGQLTVVDGTLFFIVPDQGDPGAALWRSDGTNSGTVPVSQLSYGPSDLFAAGASLFFLAPYPFVPSSHLWKSDGTDGGTVSVGDIYDPAKGAAHVVDTTAWGSNVVFASAAGGLWRSNGAADGTYPIRRFVAPPANLQVVNDSVFFAADDGRTGTELWKTDGTDAGTMLVKDINTVVVSSPPRPCAGDCNSDGQVTVDEVLGGAAIALGTAPLENCPAMDIDGSGAITVDELLSAVSNLLSGCAR